MVEEKRLRLGALLLQGLTVDEAQELTTLLIEEREEWYLNKQNEVKNIDISEGRKRMCVNYKLCESAQTNCQTGTERSCFD